MKYNKNIIKSFKFRSLNKLLEPSNAKKILFVYENK